MKKMSTPLAVSAAITAGVLMLGAESALAGKKGAEKCYGVVKAGKNDCQIKSLGTSCAGSNPKDNHGGAWVYLPKGTCEKLVGGTLKPSA